MGAAQSLAKNIPTAIRDTVAKLSDNFTKSIEEGIHSFTDAQGNFFSVIKRAEDGLIKIVQNGETIFEDIEQNVFKTVNTLINRSFDVAQEAETGIIAAGRQIEADVAAELIEIPRLVANTVNQSRRDIVVVVDDFLDNMISTVRFIAGGFLKVIHVTSAAGVIITAFFVFTAGKEAFDEFVELLSNLGGKTIEQVGNVASNVSFIPI